ncbi:prephenate dehydrogenase [Sporolactobacillus shoreae]|uniref:Prephenate dehydrogenase n=1 Tax=Sporolactobacillus shoreae TaxID=1465501 RepID=A0A4Z0GMH4_9BACL|nr:prephenate dehydrogenase [Sporolactobacillus shoreae]TGA98265.1 prephenate dehydrogenase [Sporolactobacillus shoreae]
MKTIVIDGLGLIGGSIALVIRKQWPDHQIFGVDVNHNSLVSAQSSGIIDGGFPRLQDIAAAADVIILATPVRIILDHMDQLADMRLKPGVIVTDVGSTKQQIMVKAKRLTGKGINFIGGHPMAGSHKTTISAARANLFQSAYYFLITDTLSDQNAVKDLQSLLSGLHVKWQLVSAARHDRIVAQISHLPHIIASGLVNMSQDEFSQSPLSLRLAAGGFRSITRIASSDPEMWTDILLSNSDTIVDKIDKFSDRLGQIRQAIVSSDHEAIHDYFHQAKITRDSINAQAAAHDPNFYDLFINIPDRVGAIAQVTHILAEAKINLVNIHILEIREEVDGVLQLSFSNQQDLTRAKDELRQHGLSVVRGE